MRAKMLPGALLVLWAIVSDIQNVFAGQLVREDVGMGPIPVSSPLPRDVLAAPDPPLGYIGFCLRYTDQCAPTPSEPLEVLLSRGLWLDLEGVNKTINHLIRPMSDLKHYGVPEYWTIPRDGVGDCEDYALAKRAVLASLGFPRSALRLAVVKLKTGETHAVLTVATDHGDYVLDNLTDAVRGWEDTHYSWIERQDPGARSGWVFFGSPYNPVVTASTRTKR